MDKLTEFPRLVDGVHIAAFGDDKAYLEHGEAVHRIEGAHLGDVVSKLWPILNGQNTIRDLINAVSDHIPEAEVRAVLTALRDQGLLSSASACSFPAKAPRVQMVGDNHLIDQLGRIVEQFDIEITDRAQECDVVVLAVRSLFDPMTTQLQKDALRLKTAHLYVGVDSPNRAFVGPLRRYGVLGPCLVCLRTRLVANSAYSNLRREYIEHLHQYGGRSLLHEVSIDLVASISSWLVRRIRNSTFAHSEGMGSDLILVDQETLHSTHHVLLPVPTCEVCKTAQEASTVQSAIGIESAVDSTVGIVHGVTVRKSSVGPEIHLSGTTSADSRLIRKTMRAVNNGGAGFERQTALISAIGESLERYAAGVYHSEQLRLSSWNAMDEEAVDPLKFAKFDASQLESSGFPFARFDRDTPVRWVRSVRWFDKASVWVPASQTYLPYRRARGEELVGQSISTGMAAGASLIEAVRAGLHEIIERDALAISWMHRLPPRVLDRSEIDGSVALASSLATRRNWSVKFYDISLELSPSSVVAVMEMGAKGDQVLSFGSSCRPSLQEAAEKAFIEAAQGLSYIKRLLPSYDDWTYGSKFENVEDFNHHAILYTKYPELRSKAGYIIHPTDPPKLMRPQRASHSASEDIVDQVGNLVEEISRAGHDVYVVDLTTPDLAMLGVAAVRVLVPGFVHLSGTHRTRLLGTERLRRLPGELGFRTSPDNIYPHPLP